MRMEKSVLNQYVLNLGHKHFSYVNEMCIIVSLYWYSVIFTNFYVLDSSTLCQPLLFGANRSSSIHALIHYRIYEQCILKILQLKSFVLSTKHSFIVIDKDFFLQVWNIELRSEKSQLQVSIKDNITKIRFVLLWMKDLASLFYRLNCIVSIWDMKMFTLSIISANRHPWYLSFIADEISIKSFQRQIKFDVLDEIEKVFF